MPKPLSYLDVMKPEDISIANCWTNFAGFVLPSDASAVQREEMRKAFFAGFCECFKMYFDVTALPEREAVATLDRIKKESDAFFEAMMKEHRP